MNYTKTTLPNKLRVISVPMPSVESATVTVWVRTGSRFEEKKINGISHFLEHMVFKGSKKRPSAKAISEAIDGIGGEFNAGTSKEWTNFYVKARSANIEVAFDILSDMVLNPLLLPDEIEREKGVIVQEINMYNDNPMMKINDVFENLIYSGTKLGWDISGDEKSVRSIKKDDFVNYRKRYYYAENMLLSVAGGVDKKNILKLTRKYFGDLKGLGKTLELPKEKVDQKLPRVIIKNKKTDQTNIVIGFRGRAFGDETRFAESVLSAILGGGMSSRLFIEVRERRGLCYAIKTGSDHAIDNGYLATYSGIPHNKVEEALKVILDQYHGLATKKYKISDKELVKSKEYIKGRMALALEDTREVNELFALEELYSGNPITPETIFKKIDKVTPDQIYALADEYFKKDRLNLAMIGPYKESEKQKFIELLKSN